VPVVMSPQPSPQSSPPPTPVPSLPLARASLPAGETGRGGHRPRVSWESAREAVAEAPGEGKTNKIDIVGPVCESGDFFAQDREMPELRAGDLLAVMSAGAYGFVMASNYNSRPLPAEALVQGEKVALIRKRQTIEDLIRDEAGLIR
jgi:hypothetical protein